MGIIESSSSNCVGCFGKQTFDPSKSRLNGSKTPSISPQKLISSSAFSTPTYRAQIRPKQQRPQRFGLALTSKDTMGRDYRRQMSYTPANQKHKLSLDDFRTIKILGKGTFGKVYLIQKRNDRKYYALKVLKKSDIVVKNTTDYVLTEKHVLQNSYHPFIVRLRYSFQDELKLYFVMDYVPGGDLFTHLKRRIRFDENTARFFAAEVALALQYLHEKMGVLYRDLKPENILLGADGHIRITDFGLAKASKSRQYSFCGTPEYIAPEILTKSGHSFSVDWWCLGCLIYEMLVGNPPYQNKNKAILYDDILRRKPKMPEHLSEEAVDIIERLLEKDPSERLGSRGFEEIKSHPFFAKTKWDDLLLKKVRPPLIPILTTFDEPRQIDKILFEADDPVEDTILQKNGDETGDDKYIGFSYEDKNIDNEQEETKNFYARV